jgi:hypothetical protein
MYTKKRFLQILIFGLLFVFLISFANALTQITNCVELQNMNNDLTGKYVLMNDVDCIDSRNWNGGLGFLPVGNSTAGYRFAGTFNGNGFVVKNLYMNRNASYLGLFGYTTANFTIMNTNLTNFTILGKSVMGTAGGYIYGNITHVHIKNSFINSTYYSGTYSNIGGLVSSLGVNCFITNSSVKNLIIRSGSGANGGLVGSSSGNIYYSFVEDTNISAPGTYTNGGFAGTSTGKIFNSYSKNNNISGGNYVSGFVAVGNSLIHNCWSNSTSTSNGYASGGLVGRGLNGLYINNSFWNGKMTGGTDLGGICGQQDFSNSLVRIVNSYSSGKIIASATTTYAGGISGFVKSNNSATHMINNSYSTTIMGGNNPSRRGGIAGSYTNISVFNSYWDIDVSNTTVSCANDTFGGSAYSIGCGNEINRTTTEMK